MRYIDVQWIHQFQDAPVRLVSELNDDGYEVRKLEFFRDGNVGSASDASTDGLTELSYVPIPPLEEINSDPQFRGVELQQSQFEELWVHHVQNRT